MITWGTVKFPREVGGCKRKVSERESIEEIQAHPLFHLIGSILIQSSMEWNWEKWISFLLFLSFLLFISLPVTSLSNKKTGLECARWVPGEKAFAHSLLVKFYPYRWISLYIKKKEIENHDHEPWNRQTIEE